MTRRRRLLRIVAVLAVVTAAGGAWYWWSGGDKEKPVVTTARVERGTLEITAQSSGNVEADLTVEVKSRASGEVVELKVEAGDAVKAGDLLVRLDPVDEDRNVEDAQASADAASARVAQSRAGLASARADEEEVRERLARRTAAHAAGLVSEEELRAARTALEVARRGVEQREADLRSSAADLTRSRLSIDEAKRRREETVIRAPVDGTVLAVNVDRGAIVASGISNVGGGTTLLTMADLSRLLVSVKLDEAQIGSVRKGQEARIRVDAHPDITFRGVVERVSPLGVTEANIVTFDVRVLVTDHRSRLLRPGMSTDVEIVTDHRENVLLVPTSALRRLAGRASRGEGAGREGAGREGAGREGAGREGARDGARGGDTSGWRERVTPVGDTPAAGADSGPITAGAGEEWRGRDESRPRGPRSRAVVTLAGGDTRVVVIGPSNGSLTIVEEGLNEGDEVVVGSGASRTNGANRASSPFSPPRR